MRGNVFMDEGNWKQGKEGVRESSVIMAETKKNHLNYQSVQKLHERMEEGSSIK